MKNIANNQGKVGHSEKIFSLHVRYLSFISILLILLLVAFWGMTHTRQIADQSQDELDLALSELLYSAFNDTSAALRTACQAEGGEYGRELRIAGEAVERMRGGCALYGDLRSSRLEPYLAQLSKDLGALSERAALGLIADSDRERCLALANQIDRLTEEGGTLLRTDSGGQLDLRISPYLEAGWQLR